MVGFWNRNARAKAGEVEKGLHVDGTRVSTRSSRNPIWTIARAGEILRWKGRRPKPTPPSAFSLDGFHRLRRVMALPRTFPERDFAAHAPLGEIALGELFHACFGGSFFVFGEELLERLMPTMKPALKIG
jgi:hypothetical protein